MATALTEQSQSVQSIARDMQVIAGQSETQHAVVRDSAGAAGELEAWPWNCAGRWGNSKPPDAPIEKNHAPCFDNTGAW